MYHSSRGENKLNIKSKCNKMLTFQDLPDELLLKILSFSETKDLIGCGQVSKRIRRISHDGTLWVMANLEKKIVKTELLEMILRKGCRILNLSNSKILGSLSLSEFKSQIRVLNLSQISSSSEETFVLEELLSSCFSLHHLIMEGESITPQMASSVCKNGKTLQILNLNSSYLHLISSDSIGYVQAIIKGCQELKEIDLGHVDETNGMILEDLEFLVQNISPNVEKLNLSSSGIMDEDVEILLRRCKKIRALSLEATLMTDDSLTNIRQCLNHTLEELSLGPDEFDVFSLEGNARETHIHFRLGNSPSISFNTFLELKSMQRLKILNLYYKHGGKELENLRQHLPHLMIKGVLKKPFKRPKRIGKTMYWD